MELQDCAGNSERHSAFDISIDPRHVMSVKNIIITHCVTFSQYYTTSYIIFDLNKRVLVFSINFRKKFVCLRPTTHVQTNSLNMLA